MKCNVLPADIVKFLGTSVMQVNPILLFEILMVKWSL